MSQHEHLKIVVSGDDPPMIAGSPHLDRLEEYGEVRFYDTRPASDDEQYDRVRDAQVIINSRGQVKWSADMLRRRRAEFRRIVEMPTRRVESTRSRSTARND